MIAERRRLAFGGLRHRPLHALDRVVGHGILVAEVIEQGGEGGEPMPDGRRRQPPPDELIPPGDDMHARHGSKFLGLLEVGEPDEVLEGGLVGAAGGGVA